MEDKINRTINEIALSLILFNNDIKSNNPEVLRKFIPNFVAVLNRFKDLMLLPQNRADEYCLKFKDEISDVFDDLFIKGAIYKKAENAFRQNSEIFGQVIAIKRNGNPLNDNRIEFKKQSGISSLDEFIAKYEGLFSNNRPNKKTIIANPYITLIYNKFKEFIKESLEAWTERFIYPNESPVMKLQMGSMAIEGSDRLVILAILAAIQRGTGNAFDYEKFVSERFGYKGFEKAKSTHKDKLGFMNTYNECNKILKK